MSISREKIKVIIPAAWLLVGWMWDIWYIAVRGKEMLDSDMASDMVLADLLNKEHSVLGFTNNWQYSYGLKFLGIQDLYRIWLAVFPNNWHAARLVSMGIALSLLVIAVLAVFSLAGHRDLGIWAAAFTVFPGGAWYFWRTLFSGQYLPNILISLFSLSLIMLSVKNRGDFRGKIYIVLLLLLSFAAGIDGIYQVIVFYAPLCLTAGNILLIDLRKCGLGEYVGKKVVELDGFVFAVLSVSAIVSALAGYETGLHIIRRYCHFDRFGEEVMTYQGFFECMKQFIWSYGYATDKKLMSFTGIASVCGLFFGVAVVLCGIRLLFRLKSLSDNARLLAVLSVTSILFSAFVFSYMGEEADIRLLQPVLPMGCFLVVLEVGTERFTDDRARLFTLNLAMAVFLIASLGTVQNENNGPFHEYRAKNALGTVVEKLAEQGYTQGVSLYWTSNLMTELSDGRIEMWTISNESPDVWDEKFQRKDHLITPPQGRYFYLFDLTGGEEEAYVDLGFAYIGAHSVPAVLEPIYSDDNFVVYGN